MIEENKRKFRSKIIELENDAKLIRKLSFILTTIIGNACYSEKEREKMIHKGESIGNLTDKEKELINKIWDKRTELANELSIEVDKILT